MAKDITLHLDDIRHLFNAPEFDLFSLHPRDVSGIETIMQELRLLHLAKQDANALRLTIFLPPAQITPTLREQTRAALKHYTKQKIEAMSAELKFLRWRGLRGLRGGMLFLAGCLLIAALAERAEFLPNWLSGFLYNGFIIIGWVSLWHPAEALLFDWYEPRRNRLLYQHIASMEIDIKPAG